MTKQIAVRIPVALDARLEVLAERTGRTKTFYVRAAIEAQLESLEKQILTEQITQLLPKDGGGAWANQGPDFESECRRQSELLQGDPLEAEILEELESIADTQGWK